MSQVWGIECRKIKEGFKKPDYTVNCERFFFSSVIWLSNFACCSTSEIKNKWKRERQEHCLALSLSHRHTSCFIHVATSLLVITAAC